MQTSGTPQGQPAQALAEEGAGVPVPSAACAQYVFWYTSPCPLDGLRCRRTGASPVQDTR